MSIYYIRCKCLKKLGMLAITAAAVFGCCCLASTMVAELGRSSRDMSLFPMSNSAGEAQAVLCGVIW